jgi:LysR family transcriptional regulator, glycine cleavage system transcriptional activator
MSKRITSLLTLRAFEVAARRLSFTNAAHELHVSQAAISRHVRLLETQLGRPLFRRLHRHVELTGPGKRLAGDLTQAFTQIERAVENARGKPSQRLRISVEPAFAGRWLVPRFGRFTAAFPDIDVELDSSDELRVVGRETDIAIRFLQTSARKPKGRARRLFAYVEFPVIARSLKNRRATLKSDRDVLAFRLLHDDGGVIWRRWFAAAGLDGYEAAKHLHFNDSSLAITAAIRGQGVAFSGPPYVDSQLRSGRLIRVGETLHAIGEYWLLESNDRLTAKARKAFVDWLTVEAKDLMCSQERLIPPARKP